MPDVEYQFEGETRRVEVWEGDPDRPLVLLLHGTAGTKLDMVDPHNGPDNDYDHLSPP